jgi:hypothetical protein
MTAHTLDSSFIHVCTESKAIRNLCDVTGTLTGRKLWKINGTVTTNDWV